MIFGGFSGTFEMVCNIVLEDLGGIFRGFSLYCLDRIYLDSFV